MKRLDSLNVVDKRIGALEKALEKKK